MQCSCRCYLGSWVLLLWYRSVCVFYCVVHTQFMIDTPLRGGLTWQVLLYVLQRCSSLLQLRLCSSSDVCSSGSGRDPHFHQLPEVHQHLPRSPLHLRHGRQLNCRADKEFSLINVREVPLQYGKVTTFANNFILFSSTIYFCFIFKFMENHQ